MARNVEIKARIESCARLQQRLKTLGVGACETLLQEDVFYNCAGGRLKLRQVDGGGSELIFYERPDEAGPSASSYVTSPVSDPDSMHEALERGFGVRGIVRKTRRLYLIGDTRVHLDSVERLGDFVELEVVLGPDQAEQDGIAIAERLMRDLDIERDALIEEAYIDLIEAQG